MPEEPRPASPPSTRVERWLVMFIRLREERSHQEKATERETRKQREVNLKKTHNDNNWKETSPECQQR